MKSLIINENSRTANLFHMKNEKLVSACMIQDVSKECRRRLLRMCKIIFTCYHFNLMEIDIWKCLANPRQLNTRIILSMFYWLTYIYSNYRITMKYGVLFSKQKCPFENHCQWLVDTLPLKTFCNWYSSVVVRHLASRLVRCQLRICYCFFVKST